MTPRVHLCPPLFDFDIMLSGREPRKIGGIGFEFVDYRRGPDYSSLPNAELHQFATNKRMLRAPIARALGQQRKIDTALVGTGSWILEDYAGNKFGREAMGLFLDEWARLVDLVVIAANPISIDKHDEDDKRRPDRERIIEIWKSVGFVNPKGYGSLMFYLPQGAKE